MFEEDIGVDAELELETSRERPGTTVGTFSVLHGILKLHWFPHRCDSNFSNDYSQVIIQFSPSKLRSGSLL